jgi:predicted DNA-binding WGR domain protein
MQTHKTLYRKRGNSILFWRAYLQEKSIIFTWGYVGKSIGSRIKDFECNETTLSFYEAFTNRMKQSFSYEPNICKYRLNVRVDGSTPLYHSTDQFIGFSNPIYSAIESELESNGNGFIGSLKIEDHILTIPFMVIDSNSALNKIRELLAGFGISRNHLLFLPQ